MLLPYRQPVALNRLRVESGYLGQLSLAYWAKGDLEMAFTVAFQVTAMDPEDETSYTRL